jgi:hypothetical protein
MVTRAGPIWGLSGAALAKVAARVSTDENWNPDGDSYQKRLFDWALSLSWAVETPDIIRLYTSNSDIVRQLLVPGLESGPSSGSL